MHADSPGQRGRQWRRGSERRRGRGSMFLPHPPSPPPPPGARSSVCSSVTRGDGPLRDARHLSSAGVCSVAPTPRDPVPPRRGQDIVCAFSLHFSQRLLGVFEFPIAKVSGTLSTQGRIKDQRSLVP